MQGELSRKQILLKQGDIFVLKTTMPFPLRESNAYIAESDEGWVVIDTGVNIPENQYRWTQALKEIGIYFGHISKIYITHYHHDHMDWPVGCSKKARLLFICRKRMWKLFIRI